MRCSVRRKEATWLLRCDSGAMNLKEVGYEGAAVLTKGVDQQPALGNLQVWY
jgi:hypothetical protein